MQAIRQVFAIIKRELRAWFNHPMGYLLVIVALVFNAFFYFQSIALNPVSSLRALFDLLPWLLIFLVPAVTMRLIAEERKNGMFDAVLAQPLSPWTYLAGKLLAAWSFFVITLAASLLIPLTLAPYGSFDFGTVAAQYIAALLLSLSLCAIGIATSAATRHQVTAFMLGVGISFLLVIVGFDVVTVTLGGGLRFIAEQLSIFGHYQNITRGVLDLRDALYFITLSAAAYALAAWRVLSDLFAPGRQRRRTLNIGVGLLVALFIGLNLATAHLKGRIDFTGQKLYTLSPAAGTMLGELPDIVTIKVFSSKELPPQVALMKRDVDDMLRDVAARGKGNVRVTPITVVDGETSADEARSLGIATVQFNVFKKDAFQAQAGVFGMSIEYAGGHESIPYIDRTDDLEYRVLRAVRKLTKKEIPTIAFVSGHGERSSSEMGNIRQAMAGWFAVRDIALDNATSTIDQGIRALIIAGPARPYEDGLKKTITDYVAGGGSVLALIDQTTVPTQTLTATGLDPAIGTLFGEFGITVSPTMAADMQSHETVSLQSGILSLFLPYPYWIKATVARDNPIAGDLPTVVVPWASPVQVNTVPGVDASALLTTTEAGIEQTPPFNIDPKEQIRGTQADLGKFTLAVSAIVTAGEEGNGTAGRLVVVGDTDLLADQFMSEGSPNLTFALNALDWLTQDEALISIRSKTRLPKPLTFESDSGQLQRLRWLNLAVFPALIALGAAVWLFIRRRKTMG